MKKDILIKTAVKVTFFKNIFKKKLNLGAYNYINNPSAKPVAGRMKPPHRKNIIVDYSNKDHLTEVSATRKTLNKPIQQDIGNPGHLSEALKANIEAKPNIKITKTIAPEPPGRTSFLSKKEIPIQTPVDSGFKVKKTISGIPDSNLTLDNLPSKKIKQRVKQPRNLKKKQALEEKVTGNEKSNKEKSSNLAGKVLLGAGALGAGYLVNQTDNDNEPKGY